MKFLISILSFSSCVAFAGVDGSGTGPRPMRDYIIAPSEMHSLAFERIHKADYIQTMGITNNGQVKFKFKGFDSSEEQLHSMNLNEIAYKYIEAIKRSKDSQNWEAVPVEGLGN